MPTIIPLITLLLPLCWLLTLSRPPGYRGRHRGKLAVYAPLNGYCRPEHRRPGRAELTASQVLALWQLIPRLTVLGLRHA